MNPCTHGVFIPAFLQVSASGGDVVSGVRTGVVLLRLLFSNERFELGFHSFLVAQIHPAEMLHFHAAKHSDRASEGLMLFAKTRDLLGENVLRGGGICGEVDALLKIALGVGADISAVDFERVVAHGQIANLEHLLVQTVREGNEFVGLLGIFEHGKRQRHFLIGKSQSGRRGLNIRGLRIFLFHHFFQFGIDRKSPHFLRRVRLIEEQIRHHQMPHRPGVNAILPDQCKCRIRLLALLVDLVHRMPQIDNRNVAGFSLLHDEIAALAESPIDTTKALHGGFEVFVVNGRGDENLTHSFFRKCIGDSLDIFFEPIDRLFLRIFGILGNLGLRVEPAVHIIHARAESGDSGIVGEHIFVQPPHHSRCGIARNAAIDELEPHLREARRIVKKHIRVVGTTVRDAVADEADRVVVSKDRFGRGGFCVSRKRQTDGEGESPQFRRVCFHRLGFSKVHSQESESFSPFALA